eukprot:543906_1
MHKHTVNTQQKMHHILQTEVEQMYEKYVHTIQTNNKSNSDKLYQEYLHKYEQYINEYNLYCNSIGIFTETEQPMPKQQNISTNLISDIIDIKNENLIFKCCQVSVQLLESQTNNKWRSRGNGQVLIYHNNSTNLAKIVFIDTTQNKIILFQYIDGQTEAIFTVQSDSNKNNLEFNVKGCVQWHAADYSF